VLTPCEFGARSGGERLQCTEEQLVDALTGRVVCIMYCAFCHSNNQAEFPAEMMIHFGGLKNFDNSGVLTFPKISICFDCGFSGFTTPETELRILGKGIAVPVAA
jgi:hypothetical protein